MSTSGAKRPSVYSGGVLIDGRGLPGKRVYSGGVLLDGSAPGNRVYSGGILCENKYVSITHSKISFASIWKGVSGNILVDWGDGSIFEKFVLVTGGVNVNHEYNAGTWTIKVYGDFYKVSHLSANTNFIVDISFIAELINLKYFSINYNFIVDISFIAELINLNYFLCHNNNIVDISPLAGLINLTHIYLNNNSISDISPLAGLTNLNLLYLYDNNIIYPSEGIEWPTWDGMNFRIYSAGLNEDEVDQCCIDWDDSGSHDGVYDISGTNEVPTSASAAARTHFVDVLLNTLTVSI